MPRHSSALQLCALRVAGFDASAAAPARLLVLPLGRHDARSRGPIVCNADTLSGFVAAQRAAKLDGRLALDFEHNTVPGTPAFLAEKEPRAIAGWAEAVPTAAGLEYQNIEWTPAGLQAWKDKVYQDLSPAVFRREDGTVIALHSVALCRHGELDGLTIEAAAAPSSLAASFAALSALPDLKPIESVISKTAVPGSTPTESVLIAKPVTLTATMKPTPALIALLAALSVTLSDTASEGDVEAALLDAAKKIDAMKAKPAAEPEGMSAKLDTLTAKIAALTTRAEDAERDAILQTARAEGKVVPLTADALKLTPLSVLREIVAAAKPGEVPVGSQVPGIEKGKEQPVALHADELEAYRAFGLTPEEVKNSTTETPAA